MGKRKRREYQETGDVRRKYLAERPLCEIGAVARLHDITTGCTIRATACHERVKRSHQGSLTDEDNILAACWPCNTWVEYHPELARHIGVALHPWQNPADYPLTVP